MKVALRISVPASFLLFVLECNGNAVRGDTENGRSPVGSLESQVHQENDPTGSRVVEGRVDHVGFSKVTDADYVFDFSDTYYKTMARVEDMIDTLRYRESRRADSISVQYCSLSVVRNETNIAIIEDDIIENYSVNTRELMDCAGFLTCNSRIVKSCLRKLDSKSSATTNSDADPRRDDS